MVAYQHFTKSSSAFLFSFQELWERNHGKLWFWTLTPNGLGLSDAQFVNSFGRFNIRLRHYQDYDFEGLRVFEPFQSGPLHCHLVFNQRLYVGLIRRLCAGTGLGRVVHVRKAVKSDALYMGKYLGKALGASRSGVHMWARLGRWPSVPVNRIECRGSSVDTFRAARRIAGSFAGASVLVEASRLNNDWSWLKQAKSLTVS